MGTQLSRRNLILSVLPLVAVAGQVMASEPPAPRTGDGQYVDISPVALPIVVGGRVINYVFATVRVNLTPRASAQTLRDKEPYFRDALVRAGHRTPFTLATDYTRVDEAKLKAALLPLAAAIAGPGNVASIQVMSQQPKQRSGLPRPPSATPPPAAR